METEIVNLFKELGSTGVLVVFAWILLRNLVSSTTAAQREISEGLRKHADQSDVQHRAILNAADKIVDKLNGQ